MAPEQSSTGSHAAAPPVVRGRLLPALQLRNRLTALVIDDYNTCALMERGLLQYYGVESQVVGSGFDAIDLIRSGQSFNLILIAMALPLMNGIETTKRLRAMGVDSKILAVTAHTYDTVGEDFLAAGVDEFIEKPLNPEKLVEILSELDGQ